MKLLVCSLAAAWVLAAPVPRQPQIEVPNVVGKSGRVAVLLLEARGFAVKSQDTPASDSKQWGTVIRQDPPAGAKVLPKTAVTVFVAMGARQFTVPNVVGMKPEEAMRVVREAGLTPASMIPQTVPTADWNKVRIPTIGKQTPAAGARVSEGTKVGLESYRADTVAVPNVITWPAKQAATRLQEAGFTAEIREQQAPSSSFAGKVFRQSPGAGERPMRGSKVTVYVGLR